MKDDEIEGLHSIINTQNEVIDKKDNQILILEEKIDSLQAEYDECVDSNLILSDKKMRIK